jgi:hypothetical protein
MAMKNEVFSFCFLIFFFVVFHSIQLLHFHYYFFISKEKPQQKNKNIICSIHVEEEGQHLSK